MLKAVSDPWEPWGHWSLGFRVLRLGFLEGSIRLRILRDPSGPPEGRPRAGTGRPMRQLIH